MQERTRNRLTRLARLWPVLAVLFIALSIGGAVATMGGHRNLMGLAAVGGCLTLVAMLCQLAASVAVRRWWCLAGGVLGLLLSLFVLVCSIVALAAGQYRPPLTGGEVAQPDTASFSLEEERLACSIVAVVPDDEIVRPSVGAWLNTCLGGSYQGDVGDLQAMADHYGRCHADTLRSTLEEGLPDYAELGYDARMETFYESDKVVTYLLYLELNLGGAHPSTVVKGATFRKSDGRLLGWDIVQGESADKVHNMMVDSLKNYFGASTDEQLLEYTWEYQKVGDIPWPDTPPYMTEEGFAFVYQQYEIAAYAAGLPSGTFSYQDLKPYLTDWAQGLIGR